MSDANATIILSVMSSILGSSVITAIINYFSAKSRDRRVELNELVAKANASVLKRVELCYRVRRRAEGEDAVIKNLAHENQEENEYYKSMLLVQSKWYGERYSHYLNAIKKLTGESISKAWRVKGEPSIEMEDGIKLDHQKIEKLSRQFSQDSRRFVHFIPRQYMRVTDNDRKRAKDYDA